MDRKAKHRDLGEHELPEKDTVNLSSSVNLTKLKFSEISRKTHKSLHLALVHIHTADFKEL